MTTTPFTPHPVPCLPSPCTIFASMLEEKFSADKPQSAVTKQDPKNVIKHFEVLVRTEGMDQVEKVRTLAHDDCISGSSSVPSQLCSLFPTPNFRIYYVCTTIEYIMMYDKVCTCTLHDDAYTPSLF
jgi:hypothetical protein